MLSKEQAEALAPIIAACRPASATRWDAAGIIAALAKVRDRPLPEIVRAATRAAEDIDARTPMVIAARDSLHWFEKAQHVPPPTPWDPASHCGVCSQPEDRCRSTWVADHEFVRADQTRAKLPPDQITAVVAEMRDRARPTEPPNTGGSTASEES